MRAPANDQDYFGAVGTALALQMNIGFAALLVGDHDCAQQALPHAVVPLGGGVGCPRSAATFSCFAQASARPTFHEWASALRDPAYAARYQRADRDGTAAGRVVPFHGQGNNTEAAR